MNERSHSPARLRANVARIQVMALTWMFMLVMPVIVPFLASNELGIDRVYQLQAIFAITLVLLEVPSGYMSDVIGRRGCLIMAGLLHGAAFTMLAVSSTFLGFVVFELLGALAVSLFSGSDVALLYDSMEALGDHDGRKRVLGRRVMWMQGGETVAALLTAFLLRFADASLQDIVWVNAVVGWLPFFVAIGLVEVSSARPESRGHAGNLRAIWREILRSPPFLRLVLLNLVIYGVSSLIAVWAFQDYWDSMGISILYFGYLWAAYNVTVAFVGRIAHSIEERIGAAATLVLIGLTPIVGFAGMGLCSVMGDETVWVVLGVLFGFSFQIGRGLTQVVIKDALNTRVPTEWRATANSIASMGVRLSFFVLGPALGWLIRARGYPTALGAFAVLFGILFVTANRRFLSELRGLPTMGVASVAEPGSQERD